MKYRAVANGNIVENVHPGLVEAGIYEPVGRQKKEAPEPEPQEEEAAEEPVSEYADMDYNDLRSLAADLPEDQKPKSQKKKDLIAALEAAG